jgi:hypothetical protein
MTTKIFEEFPSRDNRPAPTKPEGQGTIDMKAKIDKRISQASSDIRYKAQSEKKPIAQAFKEYMANSSLSGQERNMVKAKIFGKSMAEDYNIEQFASNSVAKALFKVFVEGVEETSTLGEEYLEELMKKNTKGETLYWVKVQYKNGSSYTRWADRSRMGEIRSNPNVASVEMVDSRPSRDQEDRSTKDYDGDGKVESGAKEHAGAVHNAIQRKKGGIPDGKDTSSVKEDVDFLEEKRTKKDKKYDVMRGKNTITMNPDVGKPYHEEVSLENGYSKFLNMIQEKTLTAAETAKKEEVAKALKPKYGKTDKTYAIATSVAKKVAEETSCNSSEPQRDVRGDYAKTNLIKNKLRSALGVKNPIVMVSNEEDVKEGLGLSVGISKAVGKIGSNPRTSAEQGARNFQKNVADPVGKAVKGAVRTVVQPANNSPAAQNARNDKYRPEEVELEGEMIDERRREDKGKPKSTRNPAIEHMRKNSPMMQALITKSGDTLGQHNAARGVRKDRTSPVNPEAPTNLPAKKVAIRKAQKAAKPDESSLRRPRAGESD